jgi:hypothetical protein
MHADFHRPQVYDVTKFLDDHPGGKRVLTKDAGNDISAVLTLLTLLTLLILLILTNPTNPLDLLRDPLRQRPQEAHDVLHW